MDPQNPPTLTPQSRVPNALTVTQPGERTLCVIKRHPMGILGVYTVCVLTLIVTAVLAFLIAPHAFPNTGHSQIMLAGSLIFVIVAMFCVAFTLIAAKVYRGNSWILTSDSITQVSQNSLFARQSSQLSLENVEDVTSEQDGILAHMFNYGLLKIETASETGKFVFMYCPNPNYYAQQVLTAREAFQRHEHGEENSPAPTA